MNRMLNQFTLSERSESKGTLPTRENSLRKERETDMIKFRKMRRRTKVLLVIASLPFVLYGLAAALVVFVALQPIPADVHPWFHPERHR